MAIGDVCRFVTALRIQLKGVEHRSADGHVHDPHHQINRDQDRYRLGQARQKLRLGYAAEDPGTDDPYFTKGQWKNADILPPPQQWGGGLPDGKLPPIPRQFDSTGRPNRWPIPNTIVHWATLLRAERPGKYDLRCRTIDANGVAQPMPRPFLKSGHNAIQTVPIVVES